MNVSVRLLQLLSMTLANNEFYDNGPASSSQLTNS